MKNDKIPESVLTRFGWPDAEYENKPFMVNLDFGGRELITNLIRNKSLEVIVEIGSFLGGSALEWLNADRNVKVICIDPWTGGWAGKWLGDNQYRWPDWPRLDNAKIQELDEPDGLYNAFLSNVQTYKERVIVVRQLSEIALPILASLGLDPDLIYIDADKKSTDLYDCSRLFPRALITGDDFLWPGGDTIHDPEKIVYPVQEIVRKFSHENHLEVIHKDQTWILCKPTDYLEIASIAFIHPQTGNKELFDTRRSLPSLIDYRSESKDPFSEPVDIVITPTEINNRHGTGPLAKRAMADRNRVLSIRSRNYYDYQDFADWCVLIFHDDVSIRSRCFRSVLTALRDVTVSSILCVPFNPDDIITAIALKITTNAPLCTWIMDDQNISCSVIKDHLMREILECSNLRFTTHPELKDKYEEKYKLSFNILPAVVLDDLVPKKVIPRSESFKPENDGILLGSFWSKNWFDRICDVFSKLDYKLTWYGDNKPSWMILDEQSMRKSNIHPAGVIPENELVDRLREASFVVVPVSMLDEEETNVGVASLSLPGRILFAVATAHIPVLVIGSPLTCAAHFVQYFDLGEVAPYTEADVQAAIHRIQDPDRQKQIRQNAARIGPQLSSKNLSDWLYKSLNKNVIHDDRYEVLFQHYPLTPGL